MLCDEVTKAADRKIKMRADFGSAFAPVDQFERLLHSGEGREAVPLQRFRHIFAHTHPHRPSEANAPMRANGR